MSRNGAPKPCEESSERRTKRTPVAPAAGVTKLSWWRAALVKTLLTAVVQATPSGDVSTM